MSRGDTYETIDSSVSCGRVEPPSRDPAAAAAEIRTWRAAETITAAEYLRGLAHKRDQLASKTVVLTVSSPSRERDSQTERACKSHGRTCRSACSLICLAASVYQVRDRLHDANVGQVRASSLQFVLNISEWTASFVGGV